MSDFGKYSTPAEAGVGESIDPGLRKFMLGVYEKVAVGLLVSAALAWVTSSLPPVTQLLYVTTPSGVLRGYTLLGNIVAFAPLVILLFSAVALRRVTAQQASILYWVIVGLLGASMGALVLRYTGSSIALTFVITAAAFGGLSLVGYTTKRSLSGMRSFLIVALWGLVLTSAAAVLLPMFGATFGIQSAGPLFWIINGLGVLITAGLIASETQHLKMIYFSVRHDEQAVRTATSLGALNLFIDFVNMFQFLLYFLGGRR